MSIYVGHCHAFDTWVGKDIFFVWQKTLRASGPFTGLPSLTVVFDDTALPFPLQVLLLYVPTIVEWRGVKEGERMPDG